MPDPANLTTRHQNEPATAPSVAREEARVETQRMNRLQAFAEIVIATGVVLTLMYYAKLPMLVLLVSILLAFILAPLVDLFTRLKVPQTAGALISILLLLLALYAVVYLSYGRAQAFLNDFPKYSGEIRRTVAHIRQTTEQVRKVTEGVVNPAAKPQRAVPEPSPFDIQQLVTKNFGSITEVVFLLSFIPFLVYFMLSWQSHIRKQTVLLFRLEHRAAAYVTLGQISLMIRSYIVGNVLVGLFMSGISMVVFGFLGLPYFYFIAVISGFLSLVPYLGVLLAAFPPIASGLGVIHSTGFLIIGVTVLALHLFALNVLYPKLIGSRLNLNPLAVTLALLFWGWLWGAMGLILAIPITGAMKIVFDHIDPLRAYGEWLGE